MKTLFLTILLFVSVTFSQVQVYPVYSDDIDGNKKMSIVVDASAITKVSVVTFTMDYPEYIQIYSIKEGNLPLGYFLANPTYTDAINTNNKTCLKVMWIGWFNRSANALAGKTIICDVYYDLKPEVFSFNNSQKENNDIGNSSGESIKDIVFSLTGTPFKKNGLEILKDLKRNILNVK